MKYALFFTAAGLILLTGVSGPLSLFTGIAFGLLGLVPNQDQVKRFVPRLLQTSVIGLGFGMNLKVVAQVGANGIGYTAAGLILTLGVGWLLGRLLASDRETTLLVSVGTAICGGSAIAAVAPVIGARHESMSVALVTVFVLNASALLFFPSLGRWMNLDEVQFGLFSALAIHDTSSVVGASLQYGPTALATATTVKLARTLWIVPLTLLVGWLWNRKATRPKLPWFILGFLVASALVTWWPQAQNLGERIVPIARRTLVLALFLIGCGFTRESLRQVGPKPFAQGVLLWALVICVTLWAIHTGVIGL